MSPPPAEVRRPPAVLFALPFYYGWVNVAAAALAMVGTLPGRIQGAAQALTVVASAVGPLLLAECVRTGSYAAMFYVLALTVSALGLGAWLLTLPAERTTGLFTAAPRVTGAGGRPSPRQESSESDRRGVR